MARRRFTKEEQVRFMLDEAEQHRKEAKIKGWPRSEPYQVSLPAWALKEKRVQHMMDELRRSTLKDLTEVWVRSEPHRPYNQTWASEPGEIVSLDQVHDETVITMKKQPTPEPARDMSMQEIDSRVQAWAHNAHMSEAEMQRMEKTISERLDALTFAALTTNTPAEQREIAGNRWRYEQNQDVKSIAFKGGNNLESTVSFEDAYAVVAKQKARKRTHKGKMANYLKQLETANMRGYKQPPMLGSEGCDYGPHGNGRPGPTRKTKTDFGDVGTRTGRSNKPKMASEDKRMLKNDEQGVLPRRKPKLMVAPLIRGIRDTVQEGGWETARTLPALNVEQQARTLAAATETIRSEDDPYDYHGIFSDDAFDESQLPSKPEKRDPRQHYGSGRPDRRTGVNGDTYTDNKDGVIYTRKNSEWKVTGAMSTNPNTPERQHAVAKEAQQKRIREMDASAG